MKIQEVKNQIESNVNLIGELINEEIDLTIGNYTRLILEYIVPINPNENTVASFLAHGINGDYTLDKSYDGLINMFKNRDFVSDTEDYLNSLRIQSKYIDKYVPILENDIPFSLFLKDSSKQQRIHFQNKEIRLGHVLEIIDEENISKFLELLYVQEDGHHIGRVGDYFIVTFINNGSQNNVYEGMHIIYGDKVALKIQKQEFYSPNIALATHEYQILTELHGHHHIIKY